MDLEAIVCPREAVRQQTGSNEKIAGLISVRRNTARLRARTNKRKRLKLFRVTIE
jgi:hypothetical protein